MKTKLFLVLLLALFYVNGYSQMPISEGIGMGEAEWVYRAENSGYPYYISRNNGRIEYVSVCYPNAFFEDKGRSDVCFYYVMKNHICDYVLKVWDAVSVEQVKQAYSSFQKVGNYYKIPDTHTDNVYAEIYLSAAGKATIKYFIRDINTKDVSKPKNENTQPQSTKERDDVFTDKMAVDISNHLDSLIRANPDRYIMYSTYKDRNATTIIDKKSKKKYIFHGERNADLTWDIKTTKVRIIYNINVSEELSKDGVEDESNCTECGGNQ